MNIIILQAKLDERLGIFWNCPRSERPTTDRYGLTSQGQGFRIALIVVSLLLALSLITLVVIGVYILYLRKNREDNNNNKNTDKESGSRQPQTLPKYQRTLEHHLDEHWYANLNLHKQPSEEVYEYVDPDATAATNPPLSSEVDADGYLLPQP